MAILTIPSGPAFTETRFGLTSNTQAALISPINRTAQLLELPGARWKAAYELPSMSRNEAVAWQAFLVQLRGRAGEFYGYDPDARTARGTAKDKTFGTLKISTDPPGQTGAALVAVGAGASETGVFLKGDYLAYDVGAGRQLHMVTSDVNADGTGGMTIPIEPPIRTPPAGNENLITTDASCVMHLVDDEIGWDANRISRYGMRFEAIEVFA
ncbi:MAG: hypothetical protein MI920_32605 [Kiloniellales bacterium]|nr:hypothetical protein [Kiloniellales bacterium]